jgi:hypothetical protein
MGDKAKPLVSSPGPAALLCMDSAFLCWPSLRENSKCSHITLRLTVKGRWTNRPLYGQKAQTSASTHKPRGYRGFLFVLYTAVRCYDLRENFSAQLEESGIDPSAIGVSSLTFGTVATHGRTDLEPGCGGAAGLLLI